MAYAQWVTIAMTGKKCKLTIKNLKVSWGKLHKPGDKDQEIKISEVEGKDREFYELCACGRSDAAAGTTGQFSLYDGDREIMKVSWDCPWGSKANNFQHEKLCGDDYIVECSPWNHDSGAIGNIKMLVYKL